MAHRIYIPKSSRKRGDTIASLLWVKMNGYEEKIISKLSEIEKISLATAKTYICELTDSSELLRKISPFSMAKHELHLSRLSNLYEILNISPEDELVKITKEVNSKFEYNYSGEHTKNI